jgi:hypothetical protein
VYNTLDIKKIYGENDFDTKCLLVSILFRILLDQFFQDSIINKLITSYTYDPDPDDLTYEAEENLYNIFTAYSIAKRITAFFQTGKIDNKMEYLISLVEWIKEWDESHEGLGGSAPQTSQVLLKRIGIMTELLWYVLYTWPIKIPSQPTPYNVKLYTGIGTSNKDANYEVFISGLYSPSESVQNVSNICFHNGEHLRYPEFVGKEIVSRDFVSSSYNFDSAARFCKLLDCREEIFCMIEFILGPGFKIPFIGASANEAEILLKPGNIYQFNKRYIVQHVRNRNQQMKIYVYQFILINDTEEYNDVFNNHVYWSTNVNLFIDQFSTLANVPLKRTKTIQVLNPNLGGSKTKKRQINKYSKSKSKRKPTNKYSKSKSKRKPTNKYSKSKQRI